MLMNMLLSGIQLSCKRKLFLWMCEARELIEKKLLGFEIQTNKEKKKWS